MNSLQAMIDETAIGLSIACAAHCLLLPVAVLVLPSAATLAFLSDAAFHSAMVLVVLPTGVIALTMGCRKHKRYGDYLAGLLGWSC